MNNNAQLNTVQYSHKYFTSTKVEWFDYPWVAQPKEVREDDDEDDDEKYSARQPMREPIEY